MGKQFIIIFGLIAILFSSCFSTYQVERASRGGQGDAHFVLYRQGIIGYAVGTRVYANGHFVGLVGANRYISCWMPEGEYLMSVRMHKADEVFFKVRLTAGRTSAYSFSYNSFRNGGKPLIKKLEDIAVINRRRPPVVNYFQ